MARLGRRFILLFSRGGSSASGSTPGGGDAPTLQFDDELNSQLLVLLEDF